MQKRFLGRIIFIFLIASLGYWILSGEKTSDHSESTVPPSSTTDHEDGADIEIPKLKRIVLGNDKKIAFFEDPASKETGSYLVGDKIAEYVISDIQHDKVMLSRGSAEIEISVNDQDDIPPYQTPSSGTSVTGMPRRTMPPPDMSSTGQTVQSDGDREGENSGIPQERSRRHPATVGSLNNQ